MGSFLSPLLLLLLKFPSFAFNSFLMSEKFLERVVASALDNPLPTRVPFTPFLTDWYSAEFFPVLKSSFFWACWANCSFEKFLRSANACSTLLKSPVALATDTAWLRLSTLSVTFWLMITSLTEFSRSLFACVTLLKSLFLPFLNSFKAALRFSTFEIHSGLIPKSFTEPLRAFSVSSVLLKSLFLPFLNSSKDLLKSFKSLLIFSSLSDNSLLMPLRFWV